MRTSILIDTNDDVLRHRIALALRGVCDISHGDGATLTISDAVSDEGGRELVISQGGVEIERLDVPFSIPALITAVRSERRGGLAISLSDGDVCSFGDRQIKLTDGEARLLRALLSGGGEFVSREDLIRDTWGTAEGGLLNVYIHYLREKLEAGGMRVILSSRKQGYKIDGKFFGGADE